MFTSRANHRNEGDIILLYSLAPSKYKYRVFIYSVDMHINLVYIERERGFTISKNLVDKQFIKQEVMTVHW